MLQLEIFSLDTYLLDSGCIFICEEQVKINEFEFGAQLEKGANMSLARKIPQ
jgi:hypothetical protein